MELLLAIGAWVLYFIINTLAWAWVGMSLGCGALMAYKMFNGSIKKASASIKEKKPEPAAAAA